MKAKLETSLVLALCMACLPVAGLAISDHAEVLEGHVTLTRVNDFDLLVTVDHLPPAVGDGVADEAFVYRSLAILPELSEIDGPARLVVRSRSLVIKTEGKSALVLATPSAEDDDAGALFAKGGSAVIINSGYQLSRLHAANGEDLIDFAYGMLYPDVLPTFKAVSGGGGGCIAGGPGSTSCSIEGDIGPGGAGCSVSCGGGYYACCTLSGCHCESGGGGTQ